MTAERPDRYPESAAARGAWERDPSHFPLPLSPAFASVYLPWQEAATRAMFAAYGYLAHGVASRLLDGYLSIRVTSPIGILPPPKLAGRLLALWWAAPPMALRVVRSIRVLRGRRYEATFDLWRRQWRPRIEAEQRAALAAPLAGYDDEALRRHLAGVVAHTGRCVRMHFLLHGAIAPPVARLEFFCRERAALDGIGAADLLAGLSHESSAPGAALRALSLRLRERPALLAAARQLPPDALPARLPSLDADLAAGFQGWLDRYGHRVTSRYEFIEPTPAEQPAGVLARLLDMAEADVGNAAARADQRREAARGEARRRLVGSGDEAEFERILAAAGRAYPLRDENVVVTYSAAFALVRYALVEVGRRWAVAVLDQADDVFFLTVDEVQAGLRNADDRGRLRLHARARRRTWERRLALPPPPLRAGGTFVEPPLDALPPAAAFMNRAVIWYLRGIQALPPENSGMADFARAAPTGPTAVRGTAASRGSYQGVARLIRGEEQFGRLRRGDVLVCEMTSPAWSVLFPLAGALVTDHGGVLSHPAVLAREFGIPAVVATRDGTARIPDGAQVTVDGDRGLVTVDGVRTDGQAPAP